MSLNLEPPGMPIPVVTVKPRSSSQIQAILLQIVKITLTFQVAYGGRVPRMVIRGSNAEI